MRATPSGASEKGDELRRSVGESRTEKLPNQINSVQRVEVTEAVRNAYVDLTTWAKRSGHAIHAKVHVADRWIAATAIAYNLDLAETVQ